MRNLKNILGLFTLLAVAACGQNGNTDESAAGDTTAVSATAGSPADEQTVATAVESLTKLMLDPDKASLESISSDALSYGHSAGKVQNKAEFIDDLINGPFDFITADVADQTISVNGTNAIVRHIFSATATNAGAPTEMKIGILQVWRNEGGQWKLLARQAFKLP